MDTLADIQRSIEQLSAEEVAELRDWLDDLDGRLLDARIEKDAADGKLDGVIAEVRANMNAGRGDEF